MLSSGGVIDRRWKLQVAKFGGVTHLRSSRAEVATEIAAVVILTWRDLTPRIRTTRSLSLEYARLSALLAHVGGGDVLGAHAVRRFLQR